VKFPLSMMASMAAYIARNRLRPRPEWQKNLSSKTDEANAFRVVGRAQPHPMIDKRFPLVLMLEPLHACNLSCAGCGRVREYHSTIGQKLTVAECLAAVDECGAPVVSVCGGEPLLYPEIGRLVAELLTRNKRIYLCTNGILLRKRLGEFTPDGRLILNVHLDGLEKTHDAVVERQGVFREAIEGIQAAKRAGFKVSTNTTVYHETDMAEIEALLEYLRPFHLDGHMLSPAYAYASVDDRDIFMTRDDVHEKFKDVGRLADRYRLDTTPVYLDFLQGKRDLPCTVWGTPTYNITGWKSPCYLITDGHYGTFEELMTRTPWESYGPGNDPRCEHCMMHCGFEPSAALGINAKSGDSFRLLRWILR